MRIPIGQERQNARPDFGTIGASDRAAAHDCSFVMEAPFEPLYFEQIGNGPLMVLLHGFPDLGSVWRADRWSGGAVPGDRTGPEGYARSRPPS